MIKSYIIGIKSNWMYFLDIMLPEVISDSIKTYELEDLKKFLMQNSRRIYQEEIIRLFVKHTYDKRPDDEKYYKKELDELGSGVSFYLIDSLSDKDSLIEKTLYQGEVFLEDKVDNINKGIKIYELS